jgi:hypothetical protein
MKNQDVIEKLKEFIETGQNSNFIFPKWIDDADMMVYVRKSRRILQLRGKMQVCLDIASVIVEQERRGKGIFSKFLKMAHEMNPWDATLVECVNNERLAYFLLKNGYQKQFESESYFLMKNSNTF